MTVIYTRQAKSFLEADEGLYKRPAAHMMIAYMVRTSSLIRETSMANRSAAIGLITQGIYGAWAEIHRTMRPYFFTDIDKLFAGKSGITLPELSEMPHIHQSMYFCFDLLEDLDRVTALLQNDPNAENVSDLVFNCWMAVYRATSRLKGIENRIKSGKAFNGSP